MSHEPSTLDPIAATFALAARWLAPACASALVACSWAQGAPAGSNAELSEAAAAAGNALRGRHGASEADRIDRGVAQALRYWRPEDGDAAALRAFLESEFLPRGETLEATFHRLEFTFERLGGYLTSLERDLQRGTHLDLGPLLPIDQRLAAYSPRAHVSEDLFSNKIAFVILLNFPLSTLPQRLAEGGSWTRRQWAEARLAQGVSRRVPAEVNQRIDQAFSEADTYISSYNIHMHRLLDDRGRRLFPEDLRLISHWGLRDELKARYADPEGLPRQRMIQQVFERIVRQQIPAAAIDNPNVDWSPALPAPEKDREPDERYHRWLGIFQAVRLADPYFADNPTFIDRRFNLDREIPEAQVRELLESVLASPLSARVARLIEKRLGRKLEPFDIWYAGFKPRGKHEESALDAITRRRYPTAEAYAADIPRMLAALGFSAEQARTLAAHIVVEPSRGAGHALGAARRDDASHLRTRVGRDGMDYKGYNIAVHEMGHNVEQVFSLVSIDHTLLQGVPNTAFTEALAFVFQSRDLELLGLEGPDEASERMRALEEFWATREIAAVGLVDMTAWRWLYEHPDATPARFRDAVVDIAEEIWDRYYADIFGVKGVGLLAVYSHMVDAGMYTPDYPLGHMIAFQIEGHLKKAGSFGQEFERICKLGALTPDAWMRQAVGSPLSAEPLLQAAAAALDTPP